jgi:hypothetical protein
LIIHLSRESEESGDIFMGECEGRGRTLSRTHSLQGWQGPRGLFTG